MLRRGGIGNRVVRPPFREEISTRLHGDRAASEDTPIVATLKSRVAKRVLPLLPVNRRVVDILRYEFRAWRTHALNQVDPRFHSKVRRLRSEHDLSINIGSGGKGREGWINIEMIPMRDTTLCLDIRRPLPFSDGSVARIFAEHVIEHIDFRFDVPGVLADWHRVLRPRGRARIVVPDAGRFLNAYVSSDKARWRDLDWDLDALPDDIHTPMHIVNHVFHQGGQHLFGYDFDTLVWALRRAGFGSIEQTSHGRSRDPELAIDQPNHALYSLYVEAVKV
jgi:predicted SAM-dependent methyltransferase